MKIHILLKKKKVTISSIDLQSLDVKYMCRNCKVMAVEEDEMFICEECQNVTTKESALPVN